jgi:hypothetical protein
MKVGNKEIKLYYSNLAARELDEFCGGTKNLPNMLAGTKENPVSYAERISNISKIITILANGEITRHNTEVQYGIADGEKLEKYPVEFFEAVLDASKINEYFKEAVAAMRRDSSFEVPEGVKLTESDEDLEEIEAEKNP